MRPVAKLDSVLKSKFNEICLLLFCGDPHLKRMATKRVHNSTAIKKETNPIIAPLRKLRISRSSKLCTSSHTDGSEERVEGDA
ncbi:uncharacterized protein LOC120351314 isoform X2 [Nilaparvata lugens]|uniref:uncharacterized protein LOC120351314 isoform X2 n=1 Tax=Nilaparvata lugens TaxID=108931 RepID=UPI00193CBFBD|nr:uncharacterized protein LOC120351314 isoform X2 [Nilaparvata lugens]